MIPSQYKLQEIVHSHVYITYIETSETNGDNQYSTFKKE